MQVVDRRAAFDRAREVLKNVREQQVVQVDFDDAPLVARPHQANQHAVVFGAGLEGAIATKAAAVELVRKVDRDLGLVGNRMHRSYPERRSSAAVSTTPRAAR